MATLIGSIQLRGTIGNLSYYEHPNGKTIVRRKGGASKERIATHRNFERTRENIRDFGTASAVAGKVRKAMAPHMEYMSDGSYFNRLVGLTSLITRTDAGSRRGERHAYDGNIHLLEDFQWNAKLAFDEAVRADYSFHMDPAGGSMSLDIASLIPLADIRSPAGATHFQIILRGCSVYRGHERGAIQMTAAPLMELNSQHTGPVTLSLDNRILQNEGEGLLIMGAGIIFYEEVDGIPFAIRGAGAFAMLSVERTVMADEETGEIPGAPAIQDDEARKAARRSASDILISSMQTQHYRAVNGRTPLMDHNGKGGDYKEKMIERGRMLWLKKLDRYRRGPR